MESRVDVEAGGSDKTLTLRVSESRSGDAGSGLARLNPEDMKALGVSPGEVIFIEGRRKTTARAVSSSSEKRGGSVLRIDGLIRQNARAGLDEKVVVAKARHAPCQKILLTPLTYLKGDMAGIMKALRGLAVTSGDRVRAYVYGFSCDLLVEATVPPGVVVIDEVTKAETKPGKGRPGEGARVSYEDIGGNRGAVLRIRKLVELPLRHGAVLERLGVEAPRGVLLYGPPGSGKTLLAKAAGSEAGAYFIHLSGPEVIHRFYGESEAHLMRVFESAHANAPAVIFIDEIHALAPGKASSGVENMAERRVVAELITLLDAIDPGRQVIVIGATEDPRMVDPALRKPGRFDKSIELTVPDRNSRQEILAIHTRGIPLSTDVDLEKISVLTHGFTGADLEDLCSAAALASLRTVFPSIGTHPEKAPPQEARGVVKVTMDDFMEALRETEASARGEVFSESPDADWADVGGLHGIRETLGETLRLSLKYPEVVRRAGGSPPKGVLLTGPRGTGKTIAVKALAKETGANLVHVRPDGYGAVRVREAFRRAKLSSPSIVFFERIEAIAGGRDEGEGESALSVFLSEMEGLEGGSGVMVAAAGERVLDKALLDPRVFQVVIEFPLPDEADRLEVLKIHARGKPVSNDIDLTSLARESEGFTGSLIEAVFKVASIMAAAENSTERKEEGEADMRAIAITEDHLRKAIESIRERFLTPGGALS